MTNHSQHPTTDKLREPLNLYRDHLATVAQQTADSYWEHHMLDRPQASSQPSALGCRVRLKGDSIYIEWYFNRWRKKRGGGYQPLSVHIAKPGRSFSYSLSKLYAHAPQWEHDMVRNTEAVFANLRRQNHQLTQIRRSVRALEQLMTELDALMAAMPDS